MRSVFVLASFWLFSFSGFCQDFNTVFHITKPTGVALALTKEVKKPDSSFIRSTTFPEEDTVETFSEKNIELTASMPLKDISKLTSGFGIRTHPVTGKKNTFHSGIDISSRSDTVFSVLPGIIEASGYNPLLGNYVSIRHGDLRTIYGHLRTRFVLTNERVISGSPIGVTGQSGRVTGEHLHFTIKYKEKYINPLTFLVRLVAAQAQGKLIASNLNDQQL